MAQLVNRGRQVLAVIAGRQVGQVLAGQVYQAGRAIVVQACLVGQVIAGRQVGLAKWGRLERQVGLAFRAGLVLVAIADQACLVGLVLVAIADQACLVGQAIRGRKGRQAIAGFRAGLANRGHQVFQVIAGIVDQVYLGIQDSAVSVVGLEFQDIADQVYLAIQGTQGILAQVCQVIVDSAGLVVGLVKLVHLDSAVYLAGLDLVASVVILDWDILD